jgi:hypothetical protein
LVGLGIEPGTSVSAARDFDRQTTERAFRLEYYLKISISESNAFSHSVWIKEETLNENE